MGRGQKMKYLKIATLLGLCGMALMLVVPNANAQRWSVGIGVGPAYPAYYPAYGPPVCSYGYFDYSPYDCAPYGYWGPQYFSSGIFIGAGPWYRSSFGPRERFYGRGVVRGGFDGGRNFQAAETSRAAARSRAEITSAATSRVGTPSVAAVMFAAEVVSKAADAASRAARGGGSVRGGGGSQGGNRGGSGGNRGGGRR